MALKPQRRALEQFGFRFVKDAGDTLIAVRWKWHWDCALTVVTWVVFVRRVQELTADVIEADRPRFEAEARRVDPLRWWPRGFQKGVAVLAVYLADRVAPGAHATCERAPRVQFCIVSLPAALAMTTGQASYLKSTPCWGGLYHAKFRHLIRHLFDPRPEPIAEPVSVLGLLLGVFMLAAFASSLMFLRPRG